MSKKEDDKNRAINQMNEQSNDVEKSIKEIQSLPNNCDEESIGDILEKYAESYIENGEVPMDAIKFINDVDMAKALERNAEVISNLHNVTANKIMELCKKCKK